MCIICTWVFPNTLCNHTVKYNLPLCSHPWLHMPPVACGTERSTASKMKDFASVIGTGLLVYSIAAHLRALWESLCTAVWGNQSLEFTFQLELGSYASGKAGFFPLCEEPAASCSPGRALQQHIWWALNCIPPCFSLSVIYVKYCFSSRLFSDIFWSLFFSIEWPCVSPVKMNGYLSSSN